MNIIVNNSRLIFKSSILKFTKVVNQYVNSSGNIVTDNQNKFCYYDITIPSDVPYLLVINSGNKSSILYAQFFDEDGQKVGSAFLSEDCNIVSVPSGATSLKWSGRYAYSAGAYAMSYGQNTPYDTGANKSIETDGSLITNNDTFVSKYTVVGSKVDIYVPTASAANTKVCFYDSADNKVGNVITSVNAGKTTYNIPSGATKVFVQQGKGFFNAMHNSNS